MVKKRKPTSLPELEQVVRAVWSEMPAAKMNTLVARMPHLCEAVLKADGGYFVEKMQEKRTNEEKLQSRLFTKCLFAYLIDNQV